MAKQVDVHGETRVLPDELRDLRAKCVAIKVQHLHLDDCLRRTDMLVGDKAQQAGQIGGVSIFCPLAALPKRLQNQPGGRLLGEVRQAPQAAQRNAASDGDRNER